MALVMDEIHPWVPIGTLLVRAGLIDSEQLEIALGERERTGRRLGELLVEWGWVSSKEIARALADQFTLDFLELRPDTVEREAVALLRTADARRLRALPVRVLADGLVLVAIDDPTNLAASEEARTLVGRPIRLAVVDAAELDAALDGAERG